MELLPLGIEGAFVVRLVRQGDERGWFARAFDASTFTELGLEPAVSQINVSANLRAGTVRGLHFQLPPSEEAKLVRCVAGSLHDVVLDVRPGSTTFGRWVGIDLDADAGDAVYVPPGCAHGYQALTDGARALYHTSRPYAPELQRGVHPEDPELAIRWPLPPRGLSASDTALPPLAGAELPPRRDGPGASA